jgi:hypothetical protein
MGSDERNRLLAWAPSLTGLSTLAWAGAKHSVAGMQLQRAGNLGRLAVQGDGWQATVHAPPVVETVELILVDGNVQSQCSCGVRRCPHAVAALVELQRKARAVADSARTQDLVMGALKQRMQGRAEARDQGMRILRTHERLPIEASVDLVALTWRQSLRPGEQELADLRSLVERIAEAAREQPQQALLWTTRLLAALSARKIVFVPLPSGAEPALQQLLAVLDQAEIGVHDMVLDQLFEVAIDGPPQLAPVVAVALARQATRRAELAERLADKLLAWSTQAGAGHWRETEQLGGRDLLWDQVGGLRLAAGELEQSLAMALAWGPGRTQLGELASQLGASGRAHDLERLLGWYDPRGALWSTGLEAAMHTAESGVAAELALWAFERRPLPAWYQWARRVADSRQWPTLRRSLIERAIVDDDPEWLAEALSSEAEPAGALMLAVTVGPLRDRCARACLVQLDQLDPLAALVARQVRLSALAQQAGPNPKTLRQELTWLEHTAQLLGEPALAYDYMRLLGREMADVPAVAQACNSR